MVELRIYSDTHLDHYDSLAALWRPPVIGNEKEQILCLCGDLWVGTRFIEFGGYSWIGEMAERFKYVLVVLGNHCYWPAKHGLTILEGANKCNAMLQDRGLTNVKVLDCDTFTDPDEPDVLFVGATLWTDMKKGDPLVMEDMTQFMRYDGDIAYETGPNGHFLRFTSQRWVATHHKHKQYIKLIAEQNKDKKIAVLTHHVPLETLIDPRYHGDESNFYYASDLSDLILDNPQIKLWGFGHTHFCQDTMFSGCRFINNSVGYAQEYKEIKKLVKHEVIEI